ncbi:hypothetical protein BKA67DRAFT_656265 [Truncatella angustata]|uniref:Uncharacterized protein n=1 Tax=Truncatella angustata TaxID=152316 RepID=A0A9P9A073_9PEZI|nr:uncharacterized protein BKA67DRAFT_656265 [Truncatella angustata]KAH6658037.1 hypothetical protein BKA67DRAFT_656265 [Truncatella angustata]
MPDAQFPQFQRLPRELQLMIWREGHPRYRHYFCLLTAQSRRGGRHQGLRLYRAINLKTGLDTGRLCRRSSPDRLSDIIDLGDGTHPEKVRLTGRINTLPGQRYHSLFEIFRGCAWGSGRPMDAHPSPAFVYMNFTQDVFFFDCSNLGCFQYLKSKPLNYSSPPPPDDHFFFNLQKLALLFKSDPDGQVGQMSIDRLLNFESNVLSRAKSLKLVYVVVEHDWDCEISKSAGFDWNEDGFVPYDQFASAHHSCSDPSACSCYAECSCRIGCRYTYTEGLKPYKCYHNKTQPVPELVRSRLLENEFKYFETKPDIQIVAERRLLWE